MSPLVLRFAALIVLGAIAAVIAWRLQQRRPDPPSAPSYRAPTQLDLADFELDVDDDAVLGAVVVFGSEQCSSCAGVWETAQQISPPAFATTQVNVEQNPELHKRYRIDGVPTLVVIDKEGVVRNAFFGPIADEVLAEALGQ